MIMEVSLLSAYTDYCVMSCKHTYDVNDVILKIYTFVLCLYILHKLTICIMIEIINGSYIKCLNKHLMICIHG